MPVSALNLDAVIRCLPINKLKLLFILSPLLLLLTMYS
nr:MAG TPA: hypothetical protein [Bacteriophage sp.]